MQECKHCGSSNLEIRKCHKESPHHAGEYCKSCGLWVRWIAMPKPGIYYAVIHTLNGVVCDSDDGECRAFPAREQAWQYQEQLFHQIADENDWCTDASQEECMTLDMMNDNGEEELLIVTVKLELGL